MMRLGLFFIRMWPFTVSMSKIPAAEQKGEEGADMAGWGTNSCRRLGISHIGAVRT